MEERREVRDFWWKLFCATSLIGVVCYGASCLAYQDASRSDTARILVNTNDTKTRAWWAAAQPGNP